MYSTGTGTGGRTGHSKGNRRNLYVLHAVCLSFITDLRLGGIVQKVALTPYCNERVSVMVRSDFYEKAENCADRYIMANKRE